MTSGRHSAGPVLITLGLLLFIASNGRGATAVEPRFTWAAAETGWGEAPRTAGEALPLGVFPALVREASLDTREAYAFAAAADNQALMQSLRCYCGCVSGLDHENLFRCFVEQALPGNLAVYSDHGVSCFTSRSETQDVRDWRRDGRNPEKIKQLVDRKYGGI